MSKLSSRVAVALAGLQSGDRVMAVNVPADSICGQIGTVLGPSHPLSGFYLVRFDVRPKEERWALSAKELELI